MRPTLASFWLAVRPVRGFGAHKVQAHLPLAPSLPPLPVAAGGSAAVYAGAPPVVYGQSVELGGDEAASVAAALVTPLDARPEHFHEWAVNHLREGVAYFECPTGFVFRPTTKSCVSISYANPTDSCPYGAYRDKASKHCVHTDSVAPDRTCPSGFGYFMRGCIRRTHIQPTFTCSPGYSKIGHRCYSMTSVSALVQCPEGYIRADNAFLSVEDVVAVNGVLNERVCKAQLMYPPKFKCGTAVIAQASPSNSPLATLVYNENETLAAEAKHPSAATLVKFFPQPVCEREPVQAHQTCASTAFQWLTAAAAFEEVNKLHLRLLAAHSTLLLHESDTSYLSKLLQNLSSMQPDANMCLSVEEQIGEIHCPVGYTSVRINGREALNNIGDVICLEQQTGIRSLNEKSKPRRDRRQAAARLLSDSDSGTQHALTPQVKFSESTFCASLPAAEMQWSGGEPICYDVRLAQPTYQCVEGEVACKWLPGVTPPQEECTMVCDLSHIPDPNNLAEVVCEPGDYPGTKTLMDLKTKAQVAAVPVCLRDVFTHPTTLCPFGLGEPVLPDHVCGALGISDLLLSCPEGYTKVSAEKNAPENETLIDKRTSKRHAPDSLATDVFPEVCELLEYAEYQVTCPAGYHREKARNTGNACVAEKTTKPSLVCPAGYLPNEELAEEQQLVFENDKACVKVVEIAPTLINPATPFTDDVLEDHRHASRGEVTACILTKTGGLSCGTERKYHGQTTLVDEEKFGQRYQEKYQRKTTRGKA